MTALDKEEQELSESVEKGKWRSVPDMEDEMRRSEAYATPEQKSEKWLGKHEKCLSLRRVS